MNTPIWGWKHTGPRKGRGIHMSRQGALVLGVALLLFVAVGASAQQGVFDSSDEKLADHEQRLAALEEAVFGDEESTATGAGPTTTTVPKVAPESPATSVVTTTTTTPEPVAQSRATPTTTTTTGAAEEKPATSGGETHLVIESDTTITRNWSCDRATRSNSAMAPASASVPEDPPTGRERRRPRGPTTGGRRTWIGIS